MMTSTDNDSSNAADNADNDDSMSITNLNACVNSINDNSHNYLSFNMSFMLSYMNSQLIYYFISDAIFTAKQVWFQ